MLSRTETKVWPVDAVAPFPHDLDPAIHILRAGGLVAFPTETVYGLGADALNPSAVARIFQAKGRPPDNPLIAHVSSLDMAFTLLGDAEQRPIVEQLAAAFWPGPLTLVVTRNERIGDLVTAGLDTVGLRLPAHPVAAELIRLLGHPLAAPSANRSGRPSPTLPEHVLVDLEGRIDGIIDGGPCSVGLESTVLDVTQWPPILLRPGGVTPEALRAAIGVAVTVDRNVHTSRVEDDGANPVRSPGMKYAHYAPKTPLVLVETEIADADRLVAIAQQYYTEGKRIGLLVTDETAAIGFEFPTLRMGPRSQPDMIATGLFSVLRAVDLETFDLVIVEGIEASGIGLAVMNRLRRAAATRIV